MALRAHRRKFPFHGRGRILASTEGTGTARALFHWHTRPGETSSSVVLARFGFTLPKAL